MRNVRSDAQPANSTGLGGRGGDSSPESFPPGHQSRLAVPRNWRASMSRRRSEGAAGSGSGINSGITRGGSGRKEQQQSSSHLEKDGEWFGDARGVADSASEKVLAAAVQDQEQDSPAMSLLCSITKASANAVPELCSPSSLTGDAAGPRQSRLRQRGGPSRPRFSSVGSAGSGGGAVGGGRGVVAPPPGDYYRLPWYRRPLPSNRRVGVAGGGEATHLKRAVADRAGAVAQQAASKATSPVVSGNAQAEVHATPTANSMAADRDESTREEGGFADRSRSGGTAVAAGTEQPRGTSPEKEHAAESEELEKLRAEVARLKREMASMAAAAATTGITTPKQQKSGGSRRRPSQRIETSSPVASFSSSHAQEKHPAWQWDATAAEGGESSDADGASRPMPNRLRADNSWMQQRRRSSSSSSGTMERRSSGGRTERRYHRDSIGVGFSGTSRPGSVLPAPRKDSSNGGERSRGSSEDIGDEVGLLSPPVNSAKIEGPSPASREKEKTAVVLEGRRRDSGADSINGASVAGAGAGAGGDGADGGARGSESAGSDASVRRGGARGNESAGSDASMRQMSVFFPVIAPPDPNADAGGTETAEGAAALASAAATRIGESVTPPGALRAARAARDAVSAKKQLQQQQQLAARHAPVVYAKIPVETVRRRGGVDGNGRVWRWVLAQRTEDQTVRQAVMSHGLPRFGRRHIWAAWAAVATPETYKKPKQSSDPAKEGSIVNTIAHDVARTKIVHPLFGSGGQGLAMLKRVLVRCAELGAVKEAGYIQGMNYLAGFMLITFADCVLSEREDLKSRSSRNRGTSGGSSTCSSNAPADSAAAGDVTEPSDVQPGPANEGSAAVETEGMGGGAEKEAAAVKEPTVAEVAQIENECVQMLQGVIALQGGVLSRDLWGLHANTELVEDLLSRQCPDVMEHLRKVNLELIVLTPRWFICIYAGSMSNQSVVTRIWDLFMWYGRRGPAVLVWVALAVLHGCRKGMFESHGLPATVKAVRRYAEGCKTFDELVRQAPVGLNEVVAAWEEQGNNRKIALLDGEGALPDRMAAGLVEEMTGEPVYLPPPEVLSPPRHRRSPSGLAPVAATSTAFGIQFPSTPGRPPTPLTSPRSPFPEWAANIFRSSTGGPNEDGGGVPASVDVGSVNGGRGGGGGDNLPPTSPRFSTPSRQRQLRRAASTSWW
ncbi:conserved unknown protein [Ectocarpus siliculosus]|uniref:Rab-GAP TBC domain-containing protein n=1 Tax=Ectocarpus siliculosus TaxID=2880 RepID=D8LQ94_ECTSI|nr:conserved unknown protein [Ectocarpus siliculosus]|eukprot:CBN77474.1 conserved unknown protein [Ectocarpus siliculosus]